MKAVQKPEQKPSKIKPVSKDIFNVFVPVIPVFVGTGIVTGIAAVLVNLVTAGALNAATWRRHIDVMNVLKNGMFGHPVIYTGINAAQVFGATPTLSGVIGAVVTLTRMDPEASPKNSFIGEAPAAGQDGILDVTFTAWLLSIVEKGLHKTVPNAVNIIATPTLSLIAINLVETFFIMPLVGFISDGMIGGINWVLGAGGVFVGFVPSILFLPMVIFGLHQTSTSAHVQMIDETGRTLLLPILAVTGVGQMSAALALQTRCKKDKELTEMTKGALPVEILEIGEPLIYGVTLPLGRPFITACIGGGIGGAVVGVTGNVGTIATGPSGTALIPLISGDKWLGHILGLLATYAGGFVTTFFFGTPKDRLEKEELAIEIATVSEASEKVVSQTSVESVIILSLVVDGTVVSSDKASDPVLAQKMMGEGYFIGPEGGHIYSPVTGVISSVFPAKHAIRIITPSGLKILPHIGVSTVDLGGMPSDVKMAERQQVISDTSAAEAGLEAIKAAGRETSMIVLVTNMNCVRNFVLEGAGKAEARAPVMDVKAQYDRNNGNERRN